MRAAVSVALTVGAFGLSALPAPAITRSCNGLIAFASNRDRDVNPEIYTLSLDGRRTELSKGLGHGSGPAPSPDGNKLAFWGNRGLLIAGTDGSNPIRVVFPPNTSGISPALTWAPDSRHFAIDIEPSSGSPTEIAIVDATSGVATTLGSGRSALWSPDSSELAFLDDVPNGGQWIFIERPDGTGRRQLTLANSIVAWSPDGSRLLIDSGERVVPVGGGGPVRIPVSGMAWTPDSSRIIGLENGELESVAADGTGAQPIGPAAPGATLSPDERRLVFMRQADRHVIVSDLDGGASHDLGAWDAGASELHMQFEPRWSPDGTKIVYWSGGRVDIADAQTGTVQALAGGPGLTTDQPVWSADGSYVFDTITDTSGDTGIDVVQPDGKGIRRVVADQLPLGGPVWSPNGRLLAFVRYTSPPSLVVTDLAGHERVLLRAASLAPAGSLPNPPLSPEGSGWPAPPIWSPDGTSVAVTSSRGTLSVDLHTGAVRRLNIFGSVAWSRDGSTAYTDGVEESFISFSGRRGMWKVPVGDFTDPNDYTDVGGSISGIAYDLAWSHDGSKLAFVRAGAENGTGYLAWVVDSIRIVDARTHRVSAFHASGADSGFAWSPDGRYIIQGGLDAEITTITGRHVRSLRGLRVFYPSWRSRCLAGKD